MIFYIKTIKKRNLRGTRTPNLMIRSHTRYPLRHEAALVLFINFSFLIQLITIIFKYYKLIYISLKI